MVSALYNEGGRYMKLIRENSRLKFLPERDGAYSIEQLDSHLLVCGKGDLILPETKIVHPIYKITFEKGTVYTAEQLVSEVGITNFRDIGGYWTQDGRQVKYGCFYRICFLYILLHPTRLNWWHQYQFLFEDLNYHDFQ